MSASQEERPFRLKTSLGDDALLIDSFVGTERISTPFRFVLRVLTADVNVDMKGLLRGPALITIVQTDMSERHIHGNISRMKLLSVGTNGMATYELELVAWPFFLQLFSDCRIFQNKSVPDILKKVFQDRGFTDFKESLTGSYSPREYCVQYRETDFNFISRLMEEEGIFYYFEQSDDKHVMVLCDSASTPKPSPVQSEARYMPSQGGRLDEDTISSLEQELKVHTGKTSLTDYDFEKPHTSLLATLSGEQKGEIYDYPGKYTAKAEGERYARLRLEEQEVELETVFGECNIRGFECGYKFTLSDHFRDSSNKEYLLTSIRHRASNPEYRSGTPDGKAEYHCQFEAIPASVPFRPRRRARKPLIDSAQTATVVGKSGEEIWTDQYGRIKVQFHWDREGKADENSSLWIRVSQNWAGKLWGVIHIPRIGQEVVVSFLEGDPDQPIITGRVYNADQMPPYTLPDEQTKSTMKSMSSKGGGGFNELRFEDKAGSEQVFLHGEKDLEVRIKNDRKEWIGQDRHLQVVRDKLQKIGRDSHSDITRDEVEKVGRDHHLDVGGKQAIKVTGSHSFKVVGDVIEEFTANQSTKVTQNIYIKGMQIVIEADTGITLKVGGNFITINPAGVTVVGTLINLNSGGAALSGSPGGLVSPLAATAALEAVNADPGANLNPVAHESAIASMTLSSLGGASPPPPPPAPAPPTHNPAAPENKEKKHWIEIQLNDKEGHPVPGERYKITLPDGSTVADGTLDDKGYARVDNIDPGNCKVTFPDIDKGSWAESGGDHAKNS